MHFQHSQRTLNKLVRQFNSESKNMSILSADFNCPAMIEQIEHVGGGGGGSSG